MREYIRRRLAPGSVRLRPGTHAQSDTASTIFTPKGGDPYLQAPRARQIWGSASRAPLFIFVAVMGVEPTHPPYEGGDTTECLHRDYYSTTNFL